jgi:XapX domain-containing protein
MKIYLISLAAGMLMGLIYAVINVRSPAPPAVALVGLLGMLIGEQLVPVAKRLISREPVSVSWFSSECAPKITGLQARTKGAALGNDAQPPSA